ncbi:MAG: Xaa-Pro peptidase family protein [Actinobacteria bacterium]|nr:Xaa-Pro peptidase family protein [Actinomycetota bacterium]
MMFPAADYAARLDSARRVMDAHGVDALMVSVGADMPYLAGYEAPQYERLTMLVVPGDGEATLLVPRLEAPAVIDRGAFEILPWDETDDPVAIALGLAGRPATAAIGDHTWARFLLGMQAQSPTTRFVPATPLTSELRAHKDEAEIGWLRTAGHAADRVAARLVAERFSGRTEREIAAITREMIVEEGHEVAAFAIVASGPNGASPHHEPADRVIGPGDPVVLDFGGRVMGYFSDTTRDFVVGEPSAAYVAAYEVLREAQAAAVDAVRPGIAAQDIDRTAREVITAAGYGEHFIHRTGHGIGIEVHEEPYIIEGNQRILKPGMAFSVEPGIYVPGQFGMRIEDIVVVTGDGSEALNLSSRDRYTVE